MSRRRQTIAMGLLEGHAGPAQFSDEAVTRPEGVELRRKVTANAEPNRDDQNESEPVVYAYVRINTPDIDPADHINPHLLVTDVEVKAKVIGGDHSLGYSLFYGMWEFLYEKVIFWF